jgi:hypothetical protein
MKKTILFFVAVITFTLMAFIKRGNQQKEIVGAWQLKTGSLEQVILLMDGYFTHTSFDKQNKKFVQTRGGTYSTANNKLTVHFEFDTESPALIGGAVTYTISQKDKALELDITGNVESWQQVDEGNSGLSGLWQITARQQQGELQPIHQTGTRKTVKILSGTRFQWAAIDPGTKQFMGTGGGTYTFANGKYTEHIEFFSRDSSRVGSSLSFDGKLEKGDWHHSGLSSKGDPIYEVWSRRNK